MGKCNSYVCRQERDALTARVAELEAALEKINVGEGWAALIARAALTARAEELEGASPLQSSNKAVCAALR
jgi:hypothetical protein